MDNNKPLDEKIQAIIDELRERNKEEILAFKERKIEFPERHAFDEQLWWYSRLAKNKSDIAAICFYSW